MKKTTVKQLIREELEYQIKYNTAEGCHTVCRCPVCGKNSYRAGRTMACAVCLTDYLKTMEE